MASVQIEDKGRMAGIAASVEKVQVLAEIPGYVVPANKNCATQTVIAGASGPVEAAIEAFSHMNYGIPLPVSHAFHSTIVAISRAPLRKVLERLMSSHRDAPSQPMSRVGITPRAGAREEILETLAQQVAAPVEWIAQVNECMRTGHEFVGGPKRALSGLFRPSSSAVPIVPFTHPKRGGLASFQMPWRTDHPGI